MSTLHSREPPSAWCASTLPAGARAHAQGSLATAAGSSARWQHSRFSLLSSQCPSCSQVHLVLFILLFLLLFLFLIFFHYHHYHLVPLYPSTHPHPPITTLWSMSMSPFSFLLSLLTCSHPGLSACSPSMSQSLFCLLFSLLLHPL